MTGIDNKMLRLKVIVFLNVFTNGCFFIIKMDYDIYLLFVFKFRAGTSCDTLEMLSASGSQAPWPPNQGRSLPLDTDVVELERSGTSFRQKCAVPTGMQSVVYQRSGGHFIIIIIIIYLFIVRKGTVSHKKNNIY